MSKATESGPPRGREGRRPARRGPGLPERLMVAVPGGFVDRLDRAAEDESMTRAEYVRRCLRRGLDASRKRKASG